MNNYPTLVNFIKENSNWQELISKAPYYISVKNNNIKNPNWYIFKYSQFQTNFNYDLCKACRGSVFEINDKEVKPICIPFQKFFNLGEGNAANIDWNNPVEISLKYDGSLIKLSKYKGEINFFTNGSMDTNIIASEVSDNDSNGGKTFQQLVDECIKKHNADDWVKNIPENITFMFELIGPENRVIIDYQEEDLIFHGCYIYIDNDPNNWHELSASEAKEKFNVPFKIPEQYHFNNINEVIDELKTWGKDKEGVVIRDSHFERIKLKSDQYLALKFVKGENGFSDKSLYNAYFENTLDDAVAVWDNIKVKADKLKEEIKSVENYIKNQYKIGFETSKKLSKKEAADLWKNLDEKNLLFEGYSNKTKTLDDFINGKMNFDKFNHYLSLIKEN